MVKVGKLDWIARKPGKHIIMSFTLTEDVVEAIERIRLAQYPIVKRSPLVEQLLLSHPMMQAALKEAKQNA